MDERITSSNLEKSNNTWRIKCKITETQNIDGKRITFSKLIVQFPFCNITGVPTTHSFI